MNLLDVFLTELKKRGFAIPDQIWNGNASVRVTNGKMYLIGWYKLDEDSKISSYMIPLYCDTELLPYD